MKKLFRTICLFAAMFGMMAAAGAQSVKTGVFTLDEIAQGYSSNSDNDIYMPPNLSVDIEFIDEDGQGVLNANENAKVRLSITNTGGDANGVKVSVLPVKNYRGIAFNSNELMVNIPANRTSVVDFPIRAGLDLQTSRDTKFNIKIFEPLGYDIEAVLNLNTLEYIKSRLIMNGVTSIADSGVGLMARNGNPDGKVQAGDVVNVTVMLQNVGVGDASNVKYTITSNDSNVLLYTSQGPVKSLTGSFAEMASGKTEELSFRVSPTNRYTHTGGYLPVYITLQEDTGFGNLASQIIPIPFDAAPVKAEVVSVDADMDRLIAQMGKSTVESKDNRVNSQPQQIRDIMAAPKGAPLYKDAVAIVIGSEYFADKTIPTAPYAARDAQVIGEYFKNSMGVGNVMVMTDKEVTSMAMNMMFDGQRGRLSKMITPGVTDVFVYYSGHGVPMENEYGGQDVLLIPYDVEKSWIKDYGFSLNKMYSDLASLDAKSVTVILDACFSGGSRPSEKYKSESVANQKFVILDPTEMEQPWLNDPDFRVFTSSKGNQTSQGRDLSKSGLFTYYLAIGLQGDADENSDGKVTMEELVDFVTVNVDKESNGAQTPQFREHEGSKGEFVLEKIR